MKILVVVDMQNDFIDGALGTPEAVKIVPYVKECIENFDGKVLFTRDTHFEDYMDTQEGKNLPVKHCIKGTTGWEIRPELDALRKTEVIDKLTFGSSALPEVLAQEENLESARLLAPYTRHIHVFHWKGKEKYPLLEAKAAWQRYLSCFRGRHCLLLEFMPDGKLQSLPAEAAALKEIVHDISV